VSGAAATVVHRVQAYNTAPESENRIHADDVARRFGFRGGLVPGVDVWAYLAHVPAERWGRNWLEQGTMRADLRRPVYDGDTVEVSGRFEADHSVSLELRDGDGTVCACGTAALASSGSADVDPAAVPRAALPSEKAQATPETLAVGTLLGTFEIGFRADRARAYLADVRESLPVFGDGGVAHPAWLLRTANWVLAENVRLGPWIHVASDVRHLGVAGDGDRLSTRARVLEEYARKGHRFVVLDVLVVANDARSLMRVRHTAIYRPRQVG
jgi:acyl dehydratase